MYTYMSLPLVDPACPDGYLFEKKGCTCTRKATPKKPRCPNGTRRNKQGVCVPKTAPPPAKKSPAKKPPAKKPPSATKKRRKRKTSAKQIAKIDAVLRAVKRPITIIKNTTPAVLSEIREQLSPLDTPGAANERSPSLNKLLVQSIRHASPKVNVLDGVLKCMQSGDGTWRELKLRALDKNPNIKLDVGGRCLKWNNKSVEQMLLRNLAKTSQVRAESIIAPRQFQTNCWFNCGFMIYFISDLGRKFTKYLRQYMITGDITAGQGKTRGSSSGKLRLYFFILNLAIEASLQGHPLAMELDTNDIIDGIYRSVLSKQTKEQWMVLPGTPGNPGEYYQVILNYLTGKAVQPVRVDTIYWMERTRTQAPPLDGLGVERKYANAIQERAQSGKSEWLEDFGQDLDTAPDIIRIVINMDDVKVASPVAPMRLACKFGEYRLDSALVGDSTNIHFCAMTTINGKYFAFDGNSFSRLSPFPWPDYLNGDRRWGFAGSRWAPQLGPPGQSGEEKKQGAYILWDFDKCYRELYYYRVK